MSQDRNDPAGSDVCAKCGKPLGDFPWRLVTTPQGNVPIHDACLAQGAGPRKYAKEKR